MPALPSYRNQSIDLSANQFTGFYMRATLAFNGLRPLKDQGGKTATTITTTTTKINK